MRSFQEKLRTEVTSRSLLERECEQSLLQAQKEQREAQGEVSFLNQRLAALETAELEMQQKSSEQLFDAISHLSHISIPKYEMYQPNSRFSLLDPKEICRRKRKLHQVTI